MDLVFDRYPWLGVKRGEIVTAIASLMHPVMSKQNALVYSKANILEALTKERYIEYASQIADLFLERFNPTTERMAEEEALPCIWRLPTIRQRFLGYWNWELTSGPKMPGEIRHCST
jgi:hypothetical protein